MDIYTKLKFNIDEELSGWQLWEVIWLLVCCGVIFIISLYRNDSVMGIISAITGVAYVVCNGKGKRCAFIFGMVNSLLYAIISYKARFYGEVMLNAFYYFPMQFYGIYVWSKNMNVETHEVYKKEMKFTGKMALFMIVIILTAIYGFIMKCMGGMLPFVDALSTVVSVVAMVVSIKMYIEQWILWFIVDAVTVVMWLFAYINGNDSISTLIMWIIYLVNAVVMYVKWSKETKCCVK